MNDILSQLYQSNVFYLAILGAVFVAVFGLLWGVRSLLATRTNVVQERLRTTVGMHEGLAQDWSPGAGPASAPSHTALSRFLGAFSRIGRPTDEEELGRLRRRLTQAGLRGELALVTYLSVKVVLCVALGLLVLWINTRRAEPLQFTALYTIVAMAIGFYMPNIWLAGRVKSRQRDIDRSLPDALDLVVTCVEAGLGLDAALDRVAQEVRLSSPLLAGELAQASLEMRAGMTRGEAFRRVAKRTGVEELSNLAAIIVQTDLFGTSVAKSLRVQADAMRLRRTQRAEERGATVAVKMTVPLILCILPALFAVLMGPAVVQIMRHLLPTLGGGN